MALLNKILFLLATLLTLTQAICDAPSPAFPPPNYANHDPSRQATSNQIISALKPIIAKPEYDTTSFSVEITSKSQSLSSFQHSARKRSELFGGGAKVIANDTRYRIASMTKPFTVLALLQLQKAGHLSLDDAVLKFFPDLVDGQTGTLPWKDITLRALMSQQAGIPRDFAQDDILNTPELRRSLGLPEIDPKDLDLPTCDEMVNYTRSCNATDFLTTIKTLLPLFAPNQHSSYSNINYDLLGLVIAKTSNTTYEDYITTHILQPLNMTQSTFLQPPDSVAAIAKDIEYYWSFNAGVQNPTGGMYSSSHDMSIWLRYVLSTYNGQTPALNWVAPTSYSGSIQTFYGVPWEIYRAKVGDLAYERTGLGGSTRPVSFVTKGGGLPGYSSIVIMMPEYELGITILVAGDGKALAEIREVVTRYVVGFAERAALDELQERYVGRFEDEESKTELVLARSAEKGLFVERWYSNGTDTFAGLQTRFAGDAGELLLYVVPTLLYVDEKNQKGERWRVVPGVKRKGAKSVWDNFCGGDWDFLQYAGKPVNEVVFWIGEDGRRVEEVGLTGFRRKLRPVECLQSGMSVGFLGQLRQALMVGWRGLTSF